MPEYRVVAGTYRTAEGERAEPGDIVDIPTERASAHSNTFEKVEQTENEEGPPGEGYAVDTTENEAESDTEAEAEAEDESEPGEDESERAPSAEIPDDYKMLSKMAAEYEGDEVHGAMSGDDITAFMEDLSDTEIAALKEKAAAELED